MVALSLRVEAVMGNVYRDERLGRRFHDLLSKDRADRIRLSRRDAAKNRLRVTSQRGTDVLIDVPRGTTLKHGDVLHLGEDEILTVEWLPEETMVVTLSPHEDWREGVETAARIGYMLGIKHFPLFPKGNEIVIPIEGSKEDLSKVLSSFGGVSLKVEKRILDVEPEILGYEHTH